LANDAGRRYVQAVSMTDIRFRRCLALLQQAELLMDHAVDGWHLARLSYVIECLKEAYGPKVAKGATSPMIH
jgi:hypothetical protein